ncbi:MAG TPA: hypothetical protein VG652_03900 [Gaiellaceae bacterium]|nr:hypothetical protein [Gaiellaceae bacterium]
MRSSILVALTMLVLAATATTASAAGLPNLGPHSSASRLSYTGYYDHHVDVYLITDVSNKAQASALHVNYAPALQAVKGLPAQYFVQGRAAAGQTTVFGSEPGEDDYNPLWEEFFVTWKAGVTPVLLGQDDQIDSLQKAGKLTVTDEHIVLNAPITKVK